MVRGFCLLTVLLLSSLPGLGQIIFGGPGIGYPGGGYPGRRYPQGGPNGPNQQGRDNNQSTLIGILRNLSDKQLVIEDDDRNVTVVTISGSTKYLTTSGAKTSSGDFQPGDRISIAAKQDDKTKAYKAESISMVHEGTADEHSLASLHTDDMAPLPRPADSSSTASNSSSSGSSNKPVLRRAASSSDDTSASASRSSNSSDDDPDRPRLRRASGSSGDTTASVSSSDTSSSTTSSPRMRRAVSSSDDSGPRAEIAPGDSSAPASPRSSSSASSSGSSNGSNDSDGPPRLRRSSPPPSDSGNEVAESRPSLHADDVNGATHLPAEPKVAPGAEIDSSGDRDYPRFRSSGDEVIDKAREAAFSFTETLPNYVVKQFTTRYATAPTRDRRVSWQALDTVTADVIEEDGHEKYKNILVNGRAPKEDVEKTGSWSSGEFSSMQLSVLLPQTNADFHGKRAVTIVNRPAFRYDFSVEKANSHWRLESEGQSVEPAYTGSIWIDKDTSRVLRIELQAQNMPRTFPTDQAESTVDYDFVTIGEGRYLLPTRAEMLGCERGTNNCTRNVIEFRNYRKFTADTSITFEPDK